MEVKKANIAQAVVPAANKADELSMRELPSLSLGTTPRGLNVAFVTCVLLAVILALLLLAHSDFSFLREQPWSKRNMTSTKPDVSSESSHGVHLAQETIQDATDEDVDRNSSYNNAALEELGFSESSS